MSGINKSEAQLLAPTGLDLIRSLHGLKAEELRARVAEMFDEAWLEEHQLELACAVLAEPTQVEFLLRGVPPSVRSVVRDIVKKTAQQDPVEPGATDAGSRARQELFERLAEQGPRGLAVRETIENAAVLLTEDPDWKGQIRYDEFRRKTLIRGQPVQDADTISIVRWLDRTYHSEWPKEKIRDAVQSVARANSFNPVLDYLAGLPAWDGVPRIEKLLFDYFPCEHDESNRELLEAYGRCFFISLIARVVRPGCQVDSVLTLQGEQGFHKSSGFRAIVPNPDWFTDDELCFDDDVRLQMQIRAKWLLEMGEFSSIKKTDVDTVKRAMTSRDSEFIPKYGHEPVVEKRTCVFVATVNPYQFLLDDGRRWWVASVKEKIDITAIERDRDLLFAEARHRFSKGEIWHLTPELEAVQRLDVKKYAITSPLCDKIREWTSVVAGEGPYEFEYLWEHISQWEPTTRDNSLKADMGHKKFFGNELKSAGWRRVLVGAHRIARWAPPPKI